MRFMLVGTGFGATHLSWLSECADASVEVLCYSQNGKRARELAGRFGVPRTATDPFSVINDGCVDAVAVVSPPDTHEAVLTAAVSAGLLVVVDKPLAEDSLAAGRLVDLVKRVPDRAFVIFQWRQNPAFARLRELSLGGRLGRIIRLDLDFHHDFLAGPTTAWPWRHRGGERGGGALSDQGVHLFDLLRWIAPGDWTVSAAVASVVWSHRANTDGLVDCEAEDTAEVLLRDERGAAHARLAVSRVSAGYRKMRTVVQGTEGLAELSADPDDGSAVLRVFATGSEAEVLEFGPHAMNPYPFILQAGKSPVDGAADFAAGYAAQLLLEQALRAGCDSPIFGDRLKSVAREVLVTGPDVP